MILKSVGPGFHHLNRYHWVASIIFIFWYTLFGFDLLIFVEDFYVYADEVHETDRL